jgi:hypothetical protein
MSQCGLKKAYRHRLIYLAMYTLLEIKCLSTDKDYFFSFQVMTAVLEKDHGHVKHVK